MTSSSKQSPKVACVYFYFREEDETELTLESIFSSFLAQLLLQDQHDGNLPPQLVKQYYGLKPYTSLPTVHEVLEFLHIQAQTFTRIYLIVDALDACASTSDPQIQAKFMKEIRKFHKHWNILITTRSGTALGTRADSDQEITAEAQESDIRLYVASRIESSDELTESLRRESAFHTALKDTICRTVVRRSKGM